MSVIQTVKGTRDFYPTEMAFRTWLYARIRAASEAFGYQEMDAPFLEPFELYAAKSGEELVKEQAFVFPDRGGELLTLRPELTPSLARMVAMRAASLPRPIRWWSFGPFWRYERPQRGRTREFFQWNIDMIGITSAAADAELAAIAATFFQSIGLQPEQVQIRVNNRELVEQRLESIGIRAADPTLIFRLLDRRERLSDGKWFQEAEAVGLDEAQISGIDALLKDVEAWRQFDPLRIFFEMIDSMELGAYFLYDPTIIRGLDYYTGTVFEARDAGGELRALLGGGRYDSLIADVGGQSLPAVGFAMGDVVLGLLLERAGIYPELRANPSEVLVPSFDDDTISASLRLSRELRDAGFKVEWYPTPDRLGKQFKYADGQGIPLVALIGPEELTQEQVTIKDLRTGEQLSVPRREVAETLRERLGTQPAS